MAPPPEIAPQPSKRRPIRDESIATGAALVVRAAAHKKRAQDKLRRAIGEKRAHALSGDGRDFQLRRQSLDEMSAMQIAACLSRHKK